MLSFIRSFRTTLLSIALVSAVVVASGAHNANSLSRRHHAFNITERDTHLQKRFSNARFTFYYVSINSCGSYDKDSDFIVALNAPQYAGGKHCYEDITIEYRGKTARAKITDLCPECKYGALDLSPSLFKYLVPGGLDVGVVTDGNWYFGGGGGGGDSDEDDKPKTTKKKTSTTTKHKPTSTSKSTSTKKKTTTTTSTSTSKTKSKTTTKAESSSSTESKSTSNAEKSTSTTSSPTSTSKTTSTTPTPTETVWDKGTINQFNLALSQLMALDDYLLASQDEA